jgi:hypothetical protein
MTKPSGRSSVAERARPTSSKTVISLNIASIILTMIKEDNNCTKLKLFTLS